MARKDKISADQLRDTAQEAAQEAGKMAKSLAEQGKNWATPKVESAIEWAAPRVEGAWKKGVEAAAPKVAVAAGKSRDAVDVAHDKIVDDVIPRLIAAMEEAAKAARGGADDLQGKANAAIAAAEKVVQEQEAQSRGGNKFAKTLGWVLVGTAVAGAGVLIWRRTQPVDDPWAEEYWDDAVASTPTHGTSAVDQAKHAASGVAASVAGVADKAKAAATDAAGKVKDAAVDAKDKVKDGATEAKDKTEDAVEDAKND